MRRKTGLICTVALLSIGASCSKKLTSTSASSPPGSSAESQSFTDSFRNADAGVKEQAADVQKAVTENDMSGAFVHLSEMSKNPALKPEEQAKVLRTQAELSQKLSAKAAQGDRDAAAILQAYQSSR